MDVNRVSRELGIYFIVELSAQIKSTCGISFALQMSKVSGINFSRKFIGILLLRAKKWNVPVVATLPNILQIFIDEVKVFNIFYVLLLEIWYLHTVSSKWFSFEQNWWVTQSFYTVNIFHDSLNLSLLSIYSLQINRVSLHHVESRQKRKQQNDAKGGLELLLTLDGLRDNLVNVVKNLKQTTNIHDVVVLSEQQKEEKGNFN